MVSAALYLSLVVLALEAYPFGADDLAVRLGLVSFVFAAAVVGSAISGRNLGAGWFRSALSALVAHIVACTLAFGVLPRLEPFDGWGSYLAVEFAVALAISVLLCASGISWWARLLVVGVAATSLSASLSLESYGPGVIPALVGITLWAILPALAALFQR